MKKQTPNYKKIYLHIIDENFPQKKDYCMPILDKDILSALDIIRLNQFIFDNNDESIGSPNKQHRSYSKSDILLILDYQKKHQLNNIELSKHFKISRNTVAKWRKTFLN